MFRVVGEIYKVEENAQLVYIRYLDEDQEKKFEEVLNQRNKNRKLLCEGKINYSNQNIEQLSQLEEKLLNSGRFYGIYEIPFSTQIINTPSTGDRYEEIPQNWKKAKNSYENLTLYQIELRWIDSFPEKTPLKLVH